MPSFRLVVARVCVLQLFVVPVLAAQDARRPLTLDALSAALERSPMLDAARAARDAARLRIGPARLLPDPRAEIGVMNRMLPGFGAMDALAMDQVTVSQMLPLATRRAAGAVAESRTREADAVIAARRAAQRADAVGMLADWWQADTARALIDATRRLLRENSSIAASMYAAGQARQADVLRVQAEVTRMTAEWMTMDAMRRTAAAGLSAMLDASLDADSLRVLLPEAGRDTVAGEAADLVAAHRAVATAFATETMARRERWPEPEVGLQLGRRPGSGERMVSIMAGASLPVFYRQRQRQMIEESAMMRRMAEADARSVSASTRAATTEALAALQRARDLQRLYDGTLLPQLQGVHESALAAVRSGTGPLDATIDALMALNTAHLARIAARADEVRSLARLERLTGRAWLAVPLASPSPESRP